MYTNAKEKFYVEIVQLELNIAHLYKIFATMFMIDKKFWLEMAAQELMNAKMICLLEEKILDSMEFAINSLNIERIHSINTRIANYSARIEYDKIGRKDAFKIALNFENEIYELQIRDVLSSFKMLGVKDVISLTIDKENQRKDRLMSYLKANYV